MSGMRLVLGGEQHPAHLPRLREPVAALLQVEWAHDRMAKDPMRAHVAHLLEAELTAEAQRLLEAERLRRTSRLCEKLRVDRHPVPRPTSGRGPTQCMEAEY